MIQIQDLRYIIPGPDLIERNWSRRALLHCKRWAKKNDWDKFFLHNARLNGTKTIQLWYYEGRFRCSWAKILWKQNVTTFFFATPFNTSAIVTFQTDPHFGLSKVFIFWKSNQFHNWKSTNRLFHLCPSLFFKNDLYSQFRKYSVCLPTYTVSRKQSELPPVALMLMW